MPPAPDELEHKRGRAEAEAGRVRDPPRREQEEASCYKERPLVITGPGAGPAVTAAGVTATLSGRTAAVVSSCIAGRMVSVARGRDPSRGSPPHPTSARPAWTTSAAMSAMSRVLSATAGSSNAWQSRESAPETAAFSRRDDWVKSMETDLADMGPGRAPWDALFALGREGDAARPHQEADEQGQVLGELVLVLPQDPARRGVELPGQVLDTGHLLRRGPHSELLCRALLLRSEITHVRGSYELAGALADEAHCLAEREQSELLSSHALLQLGAISYDRGCAAEARELFARALERFQAIGCLPGIAANPDAPRLAQYSRECPCDCAAVNPPGNPARLGGAVQYSSTSPSPDRPRRPPALNRIVAADLPLPHPPWSDPTDCRQTGDARSASHPS